MEISKTTRKANGDISNNLTTTADIINDNNDPSSTELATNDDIINMNQVNKPPDIEQDLKEMERRKRVEMVINSQLFREELERIIESQINEGYSPSSLSALQQVTELLLPNSARNSSLARFGSSAIPINDIRGVDAFNYAKGEKLLRCKLAAVYRLVDLYGWSQSIYNHISVRVSQDQEHFLLNPFGLQYHEVTASSLLKVDMQGNVINPGSTNFGFNRAGFVLHSAVHSARPDCKAIIHMHYPSCVAISSMKCGLLKISQESAIIGDVSYHDFKGIVINPDEREEIARNLGPSNKVLFLRNHGVLTCGDTIEEALHLMTNVVLACETQVKLSSIGLDNIYQMTQEAVEQVRSVVKAPVAKVHGTPKTEESETNKINDVTRETLRKWKVWDLEFEAQMRMLDNAGFRTGYIYRQPLLRADQQRPKYDIEIPPAATSLSQYFEGDKWLSPLKKLVDGKKTQDKLKWVNSPNSYQKVEISETGTLDPKKITKWIQDSSPSHSNPVKIDNPHQFVPVNGDPAEFKRRQEEMKKVRMQNKISGGPQSHILEGVTWEELNKRQTVGSGGGDETDHVVLVGAASKGIIQREFQHNATVYKSAYAKNPFDNVSDQELEEYKKYIEKKQRGEPVDDIPDRFKHLLLEPVVDHINEDHTITSPVEQIKSPQSPISDEEKASKSLLDHPKTSDLQIIITPSPDEFSESRKTEATSTSEKDKKKKGIRTPSFLKKKKHKKEKEEKA
ncbi:protein hu-li tai shao-like isoform X1 [Panonychus citri]|uniref:protein hu-li tai shao-like isoform X1 n=1 Tax=Panonychus citri TaxID=50023 RepID=UPI0023074465|nr:protein hu-li tai shao-like isoform X1 [Panonychus citri]